MNDGLNAGERQNLAEQQQKHPIFERPTTTRFPNLATLSRTVPFTIALRFGQIIIQKCFVRRFAVRRIVAAPMQVIHEIGIRRVFGEVVGFSISLKFSE